MMMERRTFIQGAIAAATTPALTALLPFSSPAELRPSPVAESMPSGAADWAGADPVVFKIDGWDYLDAKGPTGDEVFIRVNQSWQAAWR